MKMEHGAGIYKMAQKLHCKSEEIIDFSSNINSYNKTSHITLTQSMLVKYADTNYTNLKKTIAKRYQIQRKQIALYNGATAAIYALIGALKEKNITLYAPLYGEYEKAAMQADKKITKINRFKNLYKKPKRNAIVVFVNPSTPDGKFYDLKALFTLWREQNCTIVLDESFLAFENLPSLRDAISSYKKLYIVQSFTKFYACAGVRIGAVFSHQNNIKALDIPLWNLSSFDVNYLSKRLEDVDFEKESQRHHKKMKRELEKVLKNSRLFTKIYKSNANFILTKSKTNKKLFKTLYKKKILVRKCGSFDFLDDTYLRFAVKDSAAHKRLKRELHV
jgi:threonine-phosphate decarboxylase